MNRLQKTKVKVSVGYADIKNAPAYINLATVVTSTFVIILSLVWFTVKLIKLAVKAIKFTLEVVRYWLKAMVWVIDKLVPATK